VSFYWVLELPNGAFVDMVFLSSPGNHSHSKFLVPLMFCLFKHNSFLLEYIARDISNGLKSISASSIIIPFFPFIHFISLLSRRASQLSTSALKALHSSHFLLDPTPRRYYSAQDTKQKQESEAGFSSEEYIYEWDLGTHP
jgi:hypothetical protein